MKNDAYGRAINAREEVPNRIIAAVDVLIRVRFKKQLIQMKLIQALKYLQVKETMF